VSTILHLLLALALTLFLAFQGGALVFVLRSRRALLAGRRRRPTELLWTVIPVVLVLFLAARSWVAVFDLGRPAVASAVVTAVPAAETPDGPPRQGRP
jgi:heme/copper-type cytochrome/quinol oxidase subunit 2